MVKGVLRAVVRGTTTRRNLERRAKATLIAVEGTTSCSVELAVRTTMARDGGMGAVLDVVRVKSDSIGVQLRAMAFVATSELEELEHWVAKKASARSLV